MKQREPHQELIRAVLDAPPQDGSPDVGDRLRHECSQCEHECWMRCAKRWEYNQIDWVMMVCDHGHEGNWPRNWLPLPPWERE